MREVELLLQPHIGCNYVSDPNLRSVFHVLGPNHRSLPQSRSGELPGLNHQGGATQTDAWCKQ